MSNDQIKKAKRAVESGGISLLLKRAFRKTKFAIFRTNSAYWYTRDLSLAAPDIQPKIPLKVEWDFSNTVQWMRDYSMVSKNEEKEIETAVKSEHFYPNVRHGGEIIGFIRIGRDNVYVQDFAKNLRFRQGTAFVYDTYTSSDYRGKAVAPFLISEVIRVLSDKGFDRIMCHIPPWNKASDRTFTKCSFRRVKLVRYYKILGRKFFSYDPEKL